MNQKENDPDYIWNPDTSRWVKRHGATGLKVIAKYGLSPAQIATPTTNTNTNTNLVPPPIAKIKVPIKITVTSPTQFPEHSTKVPIKYKPNVTINTKIELIPFSFSKHQSIYYFLNPIKSTKLAMFDLDSTLIETLSKKIYAISGEDWKFAYDNIIAILRQFYLQGYKLMIISNQSGLSSGTTSLAEFTKKLTAIYNTIQLPIEIYVASDKDNCRKPMTDMWDFLLQNQSLLPSEVDSSSFYCGDAAGRIKGYLPGKSKDFNITDRYFAHNTGINFVTPEEVFLGMTQKFVYVDKYNTELILSNYESPQTYPQFENLAAKNLIIIVGPIASGKSTLSQSPNLTHSIVLNSDTIKNKDKLQNLFAKAIKEGKNIIIDNTNPKKLTRQEYISLAKANGYKVYCYFFDFPKILSIHLNQMRCQITHGNRKEIPIIAIHIYYKYLEKPVLDEGFEDIITLDRIYKGNLDEVELEAFNKYYHYHYNLEQH